MKLPSSTKWAFIACTAALLIGLSACSFQSQTPSQSSNDEFSQSLQIGTNGQLISIQSDNVQAAGYNAASKVMTVQFGNGAIYEYYGVEADIWTSFIGAQPHPWSQVGYPRLVQGGIPYKRIG